MLTAVGDRRFGFCCKVFDGWSKVDDRQMGKRWAREPIVAVSSVRADKPTSSLVAVQIRNQPPLDPSS